MCCPMQQQEQVVDDDVWEKDIVKRDQDRSGTVAYGIRLRLVD